MMSDLNQNFSSNDNLSSSQDHAITILEQTIAKLETVINQLNVKDYPALPLESCQQLLVTVENLANSLAITPPVEKERETSTPLEKESVTEKTPAMLTDQKEVEEIENIEVETILPEEVSLEIPKEGLDQILPSFNKVVKWWDRTLFKIRAYLPSSINDKISDWGLTGIISGLIVTILLTSVLLLPNNPAPVTSVSDLPPTEITKEIEPETNTQETEIEVIETPPELNAPSAPTPVKIVEPPQPKLTPEQKLITGIKNQVAQLTNQYVEGLIFSIQADFTKGSLKIIVTDKWNELTPNNQQKLSNKMLNKAEFLDFKKLKLFNQNGDLLARSPVVGHEMIILE